MNDNTISFGDNVRVLSTPVTQDKGLAGLAGSVFGETTPSVTGVSVIGESKSDYAINVHFESLKQDFWFAPELLELVDHAEGTVITLKGVPKKWTRTKTGEWLEESAESPAEVKKNPWWKFW